jgi:hypothetical protein
MKIDWERIRKLEGANVLVKPSRPEDPNSVGLRGTVRVRDASASQGGLRVEIVLGFPERSDMGGLPAHEELISLSEVDVLRLLAGELADTGTYEFTLPANGRTVGGQ